MREYSGQDFHGRRKLSLKQAGRAKRDTCLATLDARDFRDVGTEGRNVSSVSAFDEFEEILFTCGVLAQEVDQYMFGPFLFCPSTLFVEQFVTKCNHAKI